jgi:hypothetical protein
MSTFWVDSVLQGSHLSEKETLRDSNPVGVGEESDGRVERDRSAHVEWNVEGRGHDAHVEWCGVVKSHDARIEGNAEGKGEKL